MPIKNLFKIFKESKQQVDQNIKAYEQISEGSYMDTEFFVLLITSCIIGTIGLVQNSVAVVIGAMLMAPLMMPILGFSLSILWADRSLLLRSILTLLTGTVISIVISGLLSYYLPGVSITSEVRARTNPDLYDILVALSCGFVGAYAFVNSKISNSIPGVAIAVALMPPLCATGVSLGQIDIESAKGSLLLFLTNLIGIALAASLVFWKMRVQPLFSDQAAINKRVVAKVVFSATLLGMISLPLTYFMQKTLQVKEKEEKIQTLVAKMAPNAEILAKSVKLFDATYQIRLTLVYSDAKTAYKIRRLKNKIKDLFFKEKAVLKITILKAIEAEKEIEEDKRKTPVSKMQA